MGLQTWAKRWLKTRADGIGAASAFEGDARHAILTYMSTPGMRINTVGKTFRTSLLANLEAAAMAGWADGGGQTAGFPDLELANIQTVQLGSMPDFMVAIREARDELRKGNEVMNTLMARLGLWVRSVRATYTRFLSLARGKSKAAMATWEIGPTDHCVTCQRLNGQRHRLEWFTSRNYIPQQPGAAMVCGGWRCLCRLVDDGGAVVTL